MFRFPLQINSSQIRTVKEANRILQENDEIKLLVARSVTEVSMHWLLT